MSENSFFKPTLLYKEFMILDLIEKDANITQREISKTIGVAVSMINSYLDMYEKDGLIRRKKHSTKTVEYFVTKKGIERRKLLNIWYLKSSHKVYLSAKDNIALFLNQVINKGFKSILLYGAGEVAEIILDIIRNDKAITLEIQAVVDDDSQKENKSLLEKKIVNPNRINDYVHDGILVSSYTHHATIRNRLIESGYDFNKIIQFFD